MNSILYCVKSPIFLSLVKSNDKFSKASVTILDNIVEPFCLPPSPIHLFLWLHTERVSSIGWKNSNAFIITIIEHETQSKEGILYTALQSSSVPLCPRNVWNSVCVRAHVRLGLFKGPPHCMSAVLASVGVLIKGLSSLCLPGSSSLTRGLGHQRGAAQRGWRQAIAA